MAKDRTRHARIREPKQESLFDRAERETVQVLSGFAYAMMMPAIVLVDLADKAVGYANRILEAEHEER